MLAALTRPERTTRRGVTLLEMMVVVALVVLMMTIIVSIFQAATGAISDMRAYQELDQDLRRLDKTIRDDLGGLTAKIGLTAPPTPPSTQWGQNPKDNTGYFEYGENARADLQGEDTDDYLAFTAQAPPGRPFAGRVWVNIPPTLAAAAFTNVASYQPITVTSDYAEIIYFVRNKNLYRRVLLVMPTDYQVALGHGTVDGATTTNPNKANEDPTDGYTPLPLSPLAALGSLGKVSWLAVHDLSCRPNMSQYGRSNNKLPFTSLAPVLNTLGDLANRENRAFRPRFTDDYVTVAGGSMSAGPDGAFDDLNGNGIPDYYTTLYPNILTATIGGVNVVTDGAAVSRDGKGGSGTPSYDTLAFPYIFPGMFYPPYAGTQAQGWIHVPIDPTSANPVINHEPMLQGDNLAIPGTGNAPTWWGFPTWRETLHSNWVDPFWRLQSTVPANPDPNVSGTAWTTNSASRQAFGLSWISSGGVPTVRAGELLLKPSYQRIYLGNAVDPLTQDNGSASFAFPNPLAAWEDDLILTGVRSFDVKALDPTLTAYMDLGYLSRDGDNPANGATFTNTITAVSGADLRGFGHEGRIPPLLTDNRADAQYPIYPLYDNSTSTLRLRRVYDTWSTDYTQAPDAPAANFNPFFSPPFVRPFYPSFPPPYPVALQGLQIQIRVVDPVNQHIRTLTIRKDLSNNQ